MDLDTADFQDMQAMMNEALHTDLAPWVEDTDMFGPILKHPLVFSVPVLIPGIANRQYEAKIKALGKAVQEGNWHTVVFLHERPYRLNSLLTFRDNMTTEEYWDLVGSIWTDSENISQNYDQWLDVFQDHPEGRDFIMSEDDRARLDSLDDTITVYRGGRADVLQGGIEDGLSWTLNPTVAMFFAKRETNRGALGVLLSGTVAKEDVVAYFSSRGEAEIVVKHPEVVIIESAEEIQ